MSLRLDTEAALATGVAALRLLDPAIARLLDGGAVPPLRKRPAGLPGLVSIVVAQQVSTASAAAIAGRLRDVLPDMSPAAVQAAPDAALLGAGLARPKLRTIRAIAGAVLAGELDLDALPGMPPEDARERLVATHGIGPWTADIYLLFCLGHPDVFPAGDLALQEAARAMLGLPDRPGRDAMAAIAERWRPWRGVAAGVLWAHYRQLKAREGAPPPR